MAEQTINYGYGEAMFKDIKPKEVLAGVKDAAVSWWNEFSPGTVAKGDVEAYERVVARINNESLRKKLQEKQGLFAAFAKARGVETLVLDGALASIPLYLKFRQWRDVDLVNFKNDALNRGRNRVLDQAYREKINSPQGKSEFKDKLKKTRDELINYAKKDLTAENEWSASEWDRRKRAATKAAGEQVRQHFQETVSAELNDDRGGLNTKGMAMFDKDVAGRVSSFKRGVAGKMLGLAGVEAGVFAFRPATRLAKLQTKAGEAVGSWVVDHIVNNIVKGPNPQVAASAPKPVS